MRARLVRGAAFDAIVEVAVAGGAEGLVVESDGACSFVEFLGEGVEGAEVVGSGGNLQPARLQELLVAAVEDMGDLAVEQDAGADEQENCTDGGVGGFGGYGAFGDLGGATVFADLKAGGSMAWGAGCTVRDRSNIESLIAQDGEDVVEGSRECVFGHMLSIRLDLITVAQIMRGFKHSS